MGRSLSGAGDVNGDGLADVIIAGYDFTNKVGVSYVVFGQRSVTSTPTPGFSIAVSTLNGIN